MLHRINARKSNVMHHGDGELLCTLALLTDSLSPRTADADTDGMCGLELTALSDARGW